MLAEINLFLLLHLSFARISILGVLSEANGPT